MVEFQFVIISVEIIVGVMLAILYIKSRLPKETIDQQTKLIAALEGRIGVMELDNKEQMKKHIENERAIADLQGQIKVYKELPLQDIARSLKALEGIPAEFEKVTQHSTKQILDAVANKTTTEHVTDRVVDKETVNTQTRN